MTASFPVENEAPYGPKVQAYVDAGDQNLQDQIDNLPALGAGLLVAANNLADLDDIAASRSTLNVYSKEESNDNLTAALFPTANDVALVLASDAIAATAPVMTLHSGSDLTLTSAPTVPTGLDGQEVVLLNTGSHNITLQDSGTLSGSDLALSVAALTLHPLESVTLRYSVAATSWVATAFSAKTGSGDMQGSNNLSDVSSVTTARANLSVNSIADITSLFGNTGGWAIATNKDLYLAPPTISGGTIAGGVIRQSSGIKVVKSYTQTVHPADISIGSPFYSSWTATLSDSVGFVGPIPQKGFFGPAGVFQSEGLLTIASNQSDLNLLPLAFVDQMMVKNDAGSARIITPGWSFLSGRVFRADGAIVKLSKNDTLHGGASFTDNNLYVTENTGTFDGTTIGYEHIGFASIPSIMGNTTLNRIGFDAHDLNAADGSGIYTPYTDVNQTSILRGLFPNADDANETVPLNIGFRAGYMVRGVNNIGFWNASGSVEVPLAVSITAVGNTLPINASALAITASSAITLTSTPSIPAGIDGQRLRIVNVGTNLFGLKDESTLTGSNLLISSLNGKVLLSQNESIDLIYSNSAGKWLKQNLSKPFSTLSGAVNITDGTSSHGKITLNATSAFIPITGMAIYNNVTDSTNNPAISLATTNGQPAISFGGGTGVPDLSLTYTGPGAGTWLGTLTIPSPIITGTMSGSAVDDALLPSTVTNLGHWRTQPNFGLRVALSNKDVAPTRIAIIADSEEELASTFNTFTADFMARYSSAEPRLPAAIYGGSYAPGSLFHWSNAISVGTTNGSAAITSSNFFDATMIGGAIGGTGIPAMTTITAVADSSHATLSANATATGSTNVSIIAVRGPTGEAHVLNAGATTVSPAEPCDRIRLYYLADSATFNVSIDGTSVATGVSTAANVQTLTITTTSTNGPNLTITSSGLFDTNMIGSTITAAGIPAGARIIAVPDANHAILSIGATASASVTATITRHWWTSDHLLFGNHSVTVTGVTGTTVITNSFFYEGNYESGIQVAGLGHSGWTTADYLALSGGAAAAHVATPNSDLQTHLGLENFDAVIFATLINDGSTAAYSSAMGSLLTTTRSTLPNSTFALFTPEPVAGHTFMQTAGAAARALAASHGTLHADMGQIAYDHSSQSGGIPDQPYQLSADGIHYTNIGATIASQLLLDTLDVGPRRNEFWSTTDGTGILAPYVRENGSHLGIGVLSDITASSPSAWLGYIRSASFNGLFGAPDSNGNPQNFLVTTGASGWYLNNTPIYGGVLPTQATNLVTRAYLDAGYRRPVQAATVNALPACTYSFGTLGVGAKLTGNTNAALPTQDGVTLTTVTGSNRLLVSGQVSTFQNGIYDLTQQGDGSTIPWILTRSTSFDEAAEMVAGAGVFVAGGTLLGGSEWYLTRTVTAVGTDAVLFSPKHLGVGGLRGFLSFGEPALQFAADSTSAFDVAITRAGAGLAIVTGLFTFPGLVITDATNIAIGTTTGSKIGTSASQKIGLWNAAPVVQYATVGTTTGFSAATGTAVLSASTFTGNTGSTAYTISDVVRALKLMGVLAA